MRRNLDYFFCPLGLLEIKEEDGFLTRLDFAEKATAGASPTPLTLQVRAWLEAYFRGDVPPQLPPIRQAGTEFEQLVWRLLLSIPRGSTTTYGALAARVAALRGQPRMSAQAIGHAVGRNAVPILVPCHRVVPANGRIGGFSFGSPEVKRRLLAIEGVCLPF